MEGTYRTDLLKKWIVLAIGFFIIVPAILWFSSHGFVTVELADGATSGTINYSLTNQGNNKATSLTSSSRKITKLMSRANYEVKVTDNDSSSFVVVKSRGFLQKTVVSIKLAKKPAVQFVGNNPEGCMYYLENTLYSYGCAGATTKTTHVPATASTPTYNLKGIEGIFGSVEDIVSTKAGPVALFSTNDSTHRAFLLKPGAKFEEGIDLTDLNSADTYSLASFDEGFIAYTSSFNEIRYYPSISSKPQTIFTDRSTDASLKPQFLRAYGGAIALTYSDKADFEVNSDINAVGKVKDQVFVYANGKTRQFNFDKLYGDVTPCGTNKLCLLEVASNQLSVYDISNKAKLLYVVKGVNSIHPLDSSLVAIRNNDIIQLDIDKRGGSVVYSLNDYKFCGLQADSKDYLLCLTDIRANNVVLRVSTGVADTTNIDQKVLTLQKLQEVSAVSAYGKYVFISANLGELVYNSTLKQYTYDPDVQKEMTNRINQTIKSFGATDIVFKITNGSR